MHEASSSSVAASPRGAAGRAVAQEQNKKRRGEARGVAVGAIACEDVSFQAPAQPAQHVCRFRLLDWPPMLVHALGSSDTPKRQREESNDDRRARLDHYNLGYNIVSRQRLEESGFHGDREEYIRTWCPPAVEGGKIEAGGGISLLEALKIKFFRETAFASSVDGDCILGACRKMDGGRIERLCDRIWQDLELCLRVHSVDSIAGLAQRRGTEQLSVGVICRILYPLFDDVRMVCEPEEVVLDPDNKQRIFQADFVIRNRCGRPIAVVEAKRCHAFPRDWVAELRGGVVQCFERYMDHFWKTYYQPRPSARHLQIGGLVTDGLRWIYIEAGSGHLGISHVLTMSRETLPSLVSFLLSRWQEE